MITFALRHTAFQSTLPTRGSDSRHMRLLTVTNGISIHAPHEGERRDGCGLAPDGRDFNPRSPRGGATAAGARYCDETEISIHAPHEGERPSALYASLSFVAFQSTLPTRGSDVSSNVISSATLHFNPRSPRGGATAEKCICIQHFREFAEYYPLRHGDARCIAPQDCIIQAFFGAKKRCFYVRLCFALKNKGVRG